MGGPYLRNMHGDVIFQLRGCLFDSAEYVDSPARHAAFGFVVTSIFRLPYFKTSNSFR